MSVRVFSKLLTDALALKKVFGGNYYMHGVGYIWVLSHRDKLVEMVSGLGTLPPKLEILEELRSPE